MKFTDKPDFYWTVLAIVLISWDTPELNASRGLLRWAADYVTIANTEVAGTLSPGQGILEQRIEVQPDVTAPIWKFSSVEWALQTRSYRIATISLFARDHYTTSFNSYCPQDLVKVY